MDTRRGLLVYDLLHLGTDELVLRNLQAKRELATLTLDEVRASLDP